MSYNRVGTPRFYIDAMLLARQWGDIATENSDGLHYLNPSKIKSLTLDSTLADYVSIVFKHRYWANSLTHLFVLGHNFHTDSITFSYRSRDLTASEATDAYLLGDTTTTNNGWNLYSLNQSTDEDNKRTTFKIQNSSGSQDDVVSLCELSAGWSWTAPHSPDLELTLNFSNESIKTQTTKGGHTLSNAGYNKKAGWIRPAWSAGTDGSITNDNFNVFPSGRRSWNLKFSYLSDDTLFPSSSHDSYGIFIKQQSESFDIKNNFESRVISGTNNFQLPFIFQPNSSVEEYAICRINSDTASFNQVANTVYDCSLDIVEVW